MPTLEKLIDGYKVYKATTFERDHEVISHQLKTHTKPTTLVITASDLHMAPENLTGCNPGEMYVIRLKAGLVPPFQKDRVSGFTATLEYGVQVLEVKNIIILGHNYNDGLQMLLDGVMQTSDSDPLRAWLGHANEVAEAVKQQMGDQPRNVQERAIELETVVMNLRNLFSYPWISERVNSGKLEIYGWHFDIDTGQLLGYMPNTGRFEPFE